MSTKWIAMGLAAALSGGSALAQVEADIRRGDRVVSVLMMGEGDHVVIALHGGGGTDRRFFFSGKGGQMGRKLANAGFRVIAVNWSGQGGGGFSEVDTAIAHVLAKKLKSMQAGKMGYTTSQVGDLVAAAV